MAPHIQVTISTYSLMTGIGMFFALWLVSERNRSFLFSFRQLAILFVFNICGVVIGSKFLFILVTIPELINNFSFNKLLDLIITSGFVFYGGLFGSLMADIIFCKLFKVEISRVFAFLIPVYLTFHIFGRIGCFLAGCCYGIKSEFGFVMLDDGIRRFPVQILESICDAGILIGLLLQERRNGKKNYIRQYLFCYAICRFLLEYLRGDVIRGIWGGLSTSQWISIIIVFVIVVETLVNKWNFLKEVKV